MANQDSVSDRLARQEAKRRAAPDWHVDSSAAGIEKVMKRISDEVTADALERKKLSEKRKNT